MLKIVFHVIVAQQRTLVILQLIDNIIWNHQAWKLIILAYE